MKAKKQRQKKTVGHINRIIGQLKKLRQYIKEDRCCEEIALLAASVASSCNSLRMRTLEGFLLNEILEGEITSEQHKKLKQILKRYKK